MFLADFKRYRVVDEHGVVRRIHTNHYGNVIFAEGVLRKYIFQFMPSVVASLISAGFNVEHVADGGIF